MSDLQKNIGKAILPIIIQLIIISYVFKLDSNNCICSKMWQREYIKYYAIYAIFQALSSIILLHYRQKVEILNILFVLFTVIYIFAVISFLHKTRQCKCSHKLERYALIAQIAIFIMIILLTVSFIIFMRTILSKK